VSSKPAAFSAETPALACAAIAQKELARANRSRKNVRGLIGFAAGCASCAAAAWLLGASPEPGGLPFFLCIVAGAVGGALSASQLRLQGAACPVCKHNWEIKEGRSVPVSEQMETWDKCPGCGLLMADWALRRASQGKPRLGRHC
jgi:hypothetical protein